MPSSRQTEHQKMSKHISFKSLQNLKKYKTLVSDNGPVFIKRDFKQRRESQEIEKKESTIYHPRANEVAERANQKLQRAVQAWRLNLNISLAAFLQGNSWHNATTQRQRLKLQSND